MAGGWREYAVQLRQSRGVAPRSGRLGGSAAHRERLGQRLRGIVWPTDSQPLPRRTHLPLSSSCGCEHPTTPRDRRQGRLGCALRRCARTGGCTAVRTRCSSGRLVARTSTPPASGTSASIYPGASCARHGRVLGVVDGTSCFRARPQVAISNAHLGDGATSRSASSCMLGDQQVVQRRWLRKNRLSSIHWPDAVSGSRRAAIYVQGSRQSRAAAPHGRRFLGFRLGHHRRDQQRHHHRRVNAQPLSDQRRGAFLAMLGDQLQVVHDDGLVKIIDRASRCCPDVRCRRLPALRRAARSPRPGPPVRRRARPAPVPAHPAPRHGPP